MSLIKKITNNRRRPKIFIFILILPLVIYTTYAVAEYKPDISMIPSSQDYQVYPYSDSTDAGAKGNSKGVIQKKETSLIEYRFILRKAAHFPYAGYSLKSGQSKYLDLKGYDKVLIDVSGINLRSIRFYLVVFIDRFTQEKDYLSYCFFEKDFMIQKESEKVVLDFQEFQIPLWWINQNNIKNPNPFKNQIFKLDHVNIESGPTAETEIESGFIVREITFKQDRFKRFVFSLIYLFSAYLIIFALRYFIQKIKRPLLIVPYEKINLRDSSDDGLNKIKYYIAKHFSEPDMSLNKASKELGMHTVKIGALIKKHFNSNFKQYLNKIRIAEVKRLLAETDRQIAEIAFEAGFKDIANFNRVFKEYVKISPKEYRRVFPVKK